MATRIYWTRQAREDVRQIRAFIFRDAPITATAFVKRRRESTDRLREYPHSGQVVPELGREEIREVLRGNYRVIDRVGVDRHSRGVP